ncbi:sulfite exporter TauE/SafE family protein [Pseudoprimorskyibacter insulae]|uniref:Probable membrane transporter protein n=1 Tax=Pseudoprimorskyibacter insulae TaxID=1695997 RepID=A0A2R8B008_9RHOB|nr:sulfite exporter TauE/SafE family protein [Pseudoprimorskyibacter insulae]SPF81608.1 hypothetical protein PRI8871_03433 [Pseudoprimorskyibacter insulae]
MTETALYWGLAALASLFVGASKGGLPIIGMLSVPLMSIVMPPMVAAGLLLPIYILSDMYGIWLFRASFSRRNLAILIPAGAIGIGIGWATVSITDENAVKAMIGLVGLGFLADKMRRRYKKDDRPRPAKVVPGLFWGSMAGFTSFISHAGAPPYQVYILPQKLPKMVFAGTSTILFAVINALKLPPYIMLGQVNGDSLKQGWWLLPVALFGSWLGHRLTKIIPEKAFFVFVEVALLLVSLKLLYDGIHGYLA